MENFVVIKSFKDGLAVYLDEKLPFDRLVACVEEKFAASARFFGDMEVAVSFEGRSLTFAEEKQLVDAICKSSLLRVLCVVGKDKEQEKIFVRTLAALQHRYPQTEESGKFYRGTLQSGQILETEGSIVMIGDVMPGSSIIASKDIVVLGRLLGNAFAGGNGSDGHFVAALEMAPQKLKIGDFKYKTKEHSLWQMGKKSQPQIALVKKDEVQMQAITKEALNRLSL